MKRTQVFLETQCADGIVKRCMLHCVLWYLLTLKNARNVTEWYWNWNHDYREYLVLICGCTGTQIAFRDTKKRKHIFLFFSLSGLQGLNAAQVCTQAFLHQSFKQLGCNIYPNCCGEYDRKCQSVQGQSDRARNWTKYLNPSQFSFPAPLQFLTSMSRIAVSLSFLTSRQVGVKYFSIWGPSKSGRDKAQRFQDIVRDFEALACSYIANSSILPSPADSGQENDIKPIPVPFTQ